MQYTSLKWELLYMGDKAYANNYNNLMNITKSDNALHRQLEALSDQRVSLKGEQVIGCVSAHCTQGF